MRGREVVRNLQQKNGESVLRVTATCEGISPLLMNPMSDETLEGLRTGIHRPKPKDRSVEEEAATRLHQDSEGRVGLPSLMLFSSLINAGQRVKNGTTKISTLEKTTLPGLLAIEEFFLPFKGEPEWVADKRRGVMKNAGKAVAVCIVRPRFDQWAFDVNFLVDDIEVQVDVVRDLLRVSGKFVGLGDFRPAKRGPFGRFRIADWKVLDEVTDD